jgi:Uma2 family endonuclease
MQRRSQRRYTLGEYFAVEEVSNVKHEYYDGEIFAMAGSSLRHNHITANVLTLFRTGLRASDCSAFSSDLRLQTPGGFFTYPDVMVICGQVVLARDRPDTVTNPTLLVEVLSESTREYDRGDKFGHCREISTLRDYLLIEQDKVFVEHFQLGPNKIWAPTSHDTLSEVVALSSVNIALPLSEVYQQVFKQP